MKPTSESYTIKSSIVLPPDTNHHGTMFGGKLMAYIDDIATIAATRHARRPVVTASTDSVDFLHPVKEGDAICLSAFVTWTHRSSMEIFVRVITEDLLSGERKVCATSFLTFVALDDEGKPVPVAGVVPQTEEERILHESAAERKAARKIRRNESRKFADYLGVDYHLRGRAATADAGSAARPSAAQEVPATESVPNSTPAAWQVVKKAEREGRDGAAAHAGHAGPAGHTGTVQKPSFRAYASVWEDWG